MNFLAHCALADDAATAWGESSGNRAGLLAGAVVGDFVKGTIPTDWPTPLRAGVRLHRKIDALSNVHPAITRTCTRFSREQRRYAPIYVDILADHWLSLHWSSMHELELARFAQECYAAIHEHRAYLGARGERFFDYMRDEDLLARYHQWQHVERGLRSVLRRLDREQWFEPINAEMLQVLDGGGADFLEFYPDLREALATWNAFEAIAGRRTA